MSSYHVVRPQGWCCNYFIVSSECHSLYAHIRCWMSPQKGTVATLTETLEWRSTTGENCNWHDIYLCTSWQNIIIDYGLLFCASEATWIYTRFNVMCFVFVQTNGLLPRKLLHHRSSQSDSKDFPGHYDNSQIKQFSSKKYIVVLSARYTVLFFLSIFPIFWVGNFWTGFHHDHCFKQLPKVTLSRSLLSSW